MRPLHLPTITCALRPPGILIALRVPRVLRTCALHFRWAFLVLSCVNAVAISWAGINAQAYVTATTFMVLANLNKFVVIGFGILVLQEASSWQVRRCRRARSVHTIAPRQTCKARGWRSIPPCFALFLLPTGGHRLLLRTWRRRDVRP